jgi:hypothetical protein
MLAMEACKMSDGGQLNSGTAEPFWIKGAITNAEGGPEACTPDKFWNLRPPRATEMQWNLLVAVKKFLSLIDDS